MGRPTPYHRGFASHSRRGVALLLALAALVIVLSALGATLTTLHSAVDDSIIAHRDDHLLDDLATGDQLARTWIARHGQTAVAPLNGRGIAIADDEMVVDSGQGHLRVTLYDGLAGIPAHLAYLGSPLRFALPPAFIGITIPHIAPPSGATDLLELIDLTSGIPRFPIPIDGTPQVWQTDNTPVNGMSQAGSGPTPQLSLAEVLSMHSDGRINLNTAREELIRQTFKILNLGDPQPLLDQRAAGAFTTMVPVATQPASPNQAQEIPQSLRLVTSTDVWQALIEVSWQGTERRFWEVITGNPPNLQILQRHDASP